MTTRSKLGTAPRARSANRPRNVSCRSVRTLQHKQPLPSSTVTSLLDRNRAWSTPTSPYSLTTIAVLAPSGVSSNARIKVVFPAPRNPVTATTGRRGPRGRLWRRPKSGASLPPKRVSGPPSEVHFKRVNSFGIPLDRYKQTRVRRRHHSCARSGRQRDRQPLAPKDRRDRSLPADFVIASDTRGRPLARAAADFYSKLLG